ncbi:ASNSD1 upstream open reading frame protein-like isoform X2 [Pomacea canaliculata]|uniref:ASNSD1 upstream open reading frame protein-like isoform X2 n=1 Tax=Pomacea canaliculata TaxID=400727 RepID=UPI000D738DC0|nr:ASNSD1 upstream open reading frame protein-like isoform X2 [Pomacea canaliculata]
MDCLPQLKLPLRLKELQENIQEQKVLQSELGTLKKNAKVYRQQQNSNILFLSSLDKEMSRAKSKYSGPFAERVSGNGGEHVCT